MKAVLVGTVDKTNKLYYVLDARAPGSDGVYVDSGKPKVVDFWETAIGLRNLVPLRTTEFHEYLWDGFSDEDEADRWERIFVRKTQQIDEKLSSGLPISSDVMKQKTKSAYTDNRVYDFKSLLKTQNISQIRYITGR